VKSPICCKSSKSKKILILVPHRGCIVFPKISFPEADEIINRVSESKYISLDAVNPKK